MKGLSKTKPKSSVKKAYAINYSEIESVIKCVCNGVLYENLTFLDQRFISFIVVMYSSFAGYEEVRELKISDVYLISQDFSVTFFNGKSYKVGGQRHGVVPALLSRLYNTARIFSIYLDSI